MLLKIEFNYEMLTTMMMHMQAMMVAMKMTMMMMMMLLMTAHFLADRSSQSALPSRPTYHG